MPGDENALGVQRTNEFHVSDACWDAPQICPIAINKLKARRHSTIRSPGTKRAEVRNWNSPGPIPRRPVCQVRAPLSSYLRSWFSPLSATRKSPPGWRDTEILTFTTSSVSARRIWLSTSNASWKPTLSCASGWAPPWPELQPRREPKRPNTNSEGLRSILPTAGKDGVKVGRPQGRRSSTRCSSNPGKPDRRW